MLGQTVHALLKISGRIEEGDRDSVVPDDALAGGNALAADHGCSQSASVGFGRKIQVQRDLAAWGEVQLRQQEQPRAARVAGDRAANLRAFEFDLRHQVYGLAGDEPLVFGFGHSFQCSPGRRDFQPIPDARKESPLFYDSRNLQANACTERRALTLSCKSKPARKPATKPRA